MFFRVLKKEIKEKIGFNIILFLFMIVASSLLVASTLLLYMNQAGYENAYKICNSSDVFLIVEQSKNNHAEQLEIVEQWLLEREEVENTDYAETLRYNSLTLDFEHFDEVNSTEFKDYIYYLFKMPQEQNLILNMDDNSFIVENGCVAIPKILQLLTGTQVGDKLRITTQMGGIYEFTVSHIFKDPAIMQFRRLIVSDSDFEILYQESPLKYDFYEIQTKDKCDVTEHFKLIQDFRQENISIDVSYSCVKDEMSYYAIMARVITLFMSIMSVFMLLLILMTIRFTMISVIKREECEIGVMKAIGVDSAMLRWLYIAKYIVFSVIGSLFGVLFGIPVSKTLFKLFYIHMVSPSVTVLMSIAVGGIIIFNIFVIAFLFLAMRRINKVNVIDVLHGENRGERFNKLPGFFLHRSKYIKIPLFLAITDLVGRIKRYIFLLAAYMLGISIIFIAAQLKDTVISNEYFRRYDTMGNYEFEIHLDAELKELYYGKSGDKQGAIKRVNQDLANANIPAVTECMNITQGKLGFEEKECFALMGWGISDTADVTYRKGSVPPRLYSEVALDYCTADMFEIRIGDTIHITYKKPTADERTSRIVTEDFIVTGIFDNMLNGVSKVIMGNDFNDAIIFQSPRFRAEIYAPEWKKSYYIEKMRELYGEDNVWDEERILKDLLGGYYNMVTMLRNIISVVVIMVLILITILYQNIFMDEEISSVALLKSMGIDSDNVKLWQYLRILILVIVAFLGAMIVTATLGRWFIRIIFATIVKVTGFTLRFHSITNYIVILLALLIIITITLCIILKPIEKIQTWRIRNE